LLLGVDYESSFLVSILVRVLVLPYLFVAGLLYLRHRADFGQAKMSEAKDMRTEEGPQ
jgi:hypothetical protein